MLEYSTIRRNGDMWEWTDASDAEARSSRLTPVMNAAAEYGWRVLASVEGIVVLEREKEIPSGD